MCNVCAADEIVRGGDEGATFTWKFYDGGIQVRARRVAPGTGVEFVAMEYQIRAKGAAWPETWTPTKDLPSDPVSAYGLDVVSPSEAAIVLLKGAGK